MEAFIPSSVQFRALASLESRKVDIVCKGGIGGETHAEGQFCALI